MKRWPRNFKESCNLNQFRSICSSEISRDPPSSAAKPAGLSEGANRGSTWDRSYPSDQGKIERYGGLFFCFVSFPFWAFFWISVSLLLCFSAFPCFFVFYSSLLLSFSAFLLFPAFLLFQLLCLHAFLLLCFSLFFLFLILQIILKKHHVNEP